VQLLNADGSPQISGNYFMKGSINFWLAIPYVGKLLKFAGDLASVKKPNVPDSDAPVEVDWINGAFLMVKKEVVNRVGKMDEDFFLYAEETEWCHRIGKLYKLCIFGQYKVTHLVGASSGTAFNSDGGYANIFDKKGLQYLLSNFLRIYKQHGKAWYILHLMVFSFSVPVVYTGALLSFSNRKEKLQQVRGLAKNIVAIWNYTPTIYKGEPHFYKVL
ncbi:MAG: glycosyltransferase family 2 protein, partial [Flavitalea sp.]